MLHRWAAIMHEQTTHGSRKVQDQKHGNLAHGALNAISVLNLVGFEFPDLIDYGQVMDVQDNLVAI